MTKEELNLIAKHIYSGQGKRGLKVRLYTFALQHGICYGQFNDGWYAAKHTMENEGTENQRYTMDSIKGILIQIGRKRLTPKPRKTVIERDQPS